MLDVVKQELGKEGVLPLARFFASDWPMNAPTGALFLHWLVTSAVILGSATSDTYTFVTNMFLYSGSIIKCRKPPLSLLRCRLLTERSPRRRWPLIPDVEPQGELERAANQVPELSAPHHLLALLPSLCHRRAVDPEQHPVGDSLLCRPRPRNGHAICWCGLLVLLGQGLTDVGFPHPTRDHTTARW